LESSFEQSDFKNVLIMPLIVLVVVQTTKQGKAQILVERSILYI
jgi:hypothetical protein